MTLPLESEVAAMRAELSAFKDRQAITDLMFRYCQLIDNLDIEGVLSEIFAPDGIDDHGAYAAEGTEGIRAFMTGSTANLIATLHHVSNIVIDLDGDTATLKAMFVSWAWTRDSSNSGHMRPADYVSGGYYVDELKRLPEGWRVARRVLETNGVSPVLYGTVPLSQDHFYGLARRLQETEPPH